MKAIAQPMAKTSLSESAARLAIAAATGVFLLLAGLHILSPEFDPSWRMVSEYANGNYSWILSLMFISWALSSWALGLALWSQVRTRGGRVGLFFLIAAGAGEAMASVFDINHPLHGLSALIGIGSLPVAAMLVSLSLSRTEGWSLGRNSLLWTANLTWVSVLLMAATFALLMVTFTQAGGDMSAGAAPTVLPPGVIALVGWANRLLIVIYCLWAMTAASQSLKLRS